MIWLSLQNDQGNNCEEDWTVLTNERAGANSTVAQKTTWRCSFHHLSWTDLKSNWFENLFSVIRAEMKDMIKHMEKRSAHSAAVSNEKIKLIMRLHSYSHKVSRKSCHCSSWQKALWQQELAIASDKETSRCVPWVPPNFWTFLPLSSLILETLLHQEILCLQKNLSISWCCKEWGMKLGRLLAEILKYWFPRRWGFRSTQTLIPVASYKLHYLTPKGTVIPGLH